MKINKIRLVAVLMLLVGLILINAGLRLLKENKETFCAIPFGCVAHAVWG